MCVNEDCRCENGQVSSMTDDDLTFFLFWLILDEDEEKSEEVREWTSTDSSSMS